MIHRIICEFDSGNHATLRSDASVREAKISYNSESTKVITICSSSHIDVWRSTSKLLLEFVLADTYEVYVPEAEIELFRQCTDSQIKILPQEGLDSGFGQKLKKAIDKSGNSQRFGWYLQQFYKIEALRRAKEQRLVIWDADCVPCRPIPLYTDGGSPIYMRASNEYHEDYFDFIKNFLKIDRIQDFSFVIPSFPLRGEWIKQFVAEIEASHPGKTWWDAIISAIDLKLRSGFSETETLGTWIVHAHPYSWTTVKGTWERRGQQRFGYARNFNPERLVKIGEKYNLDIVTFENWNLRGLKLFRASITEWVKWVVKIIRQGPMPR